MGKSTIGEHKRAVLDALLYVGLRNGLPVQHVYNLRGARNSDQVGHRIWDRFALLLVQVFMSVVVGGLRGGHRDSCMEQRNRKFHNRFIVPVIGLCRRSCRRGNQSVCCLDFVLFLSERRHVL